MILRCMLFVLLLCAAGLDAGGRHRVGYDGAQGGFIELDAEQRIPRWREVPVWSDRDGRYRWEQVLRDDGHTIETFDLDNKRYRIYHMVPARKRDRPKRPMR